MNADDELEKRMRKVLGVGQPAKAAPAAQPGPDAPVFEVTEVHDGDVMRIWFHRIEGKRRRPHKSFSGRDGAREEAARLRREGARVTWLCDEWFPSL